MVDGGKSQGRDEMVAVAKTMAVAIKHRGPDDCGAWVDERQGVALGHRRLSVLDLSQEGHQPMVSASGRFVLVFNGEIYNYREIRAELETNEWSGVWRGHSDTEVMLAACEEYGVESAVKRWNGMFAVALFDRQSRELILIRDRMGEKPLYYGWQNGTFLFGSELKALMVHPEFRGQMNLSAVSAYLRLGYVPAPLSIYEGIYKLPPGHMLRIKTGTVGQRPREMAYWTMPMQGNELKGDLSTVAEELRSILQRAVNLRVHADVPVGALLSGGVDSSLIAALMQESPAGVVRTYSIGFEDRAHDESKYAAAVAGRMGTRHEELYVSAQAALAEVPQLPRIFDEPFADSSQIPTLILSKLTRQYVTVALTGDGGDEIFGGYVRYLNAHMLESMYRYVPSTMRRGLARAARVLATPRWDELIRTAPRAVSVAFSAERVRKLSGVLGASGIEQMYGNIISQWTDPAEIAQGLPLAHAGFESLPCAKELKGSEQWMMYCDALTYLPDDILVKVDRASMAVALECRVPYLDHNVVEFAARIPTKFKVKSGQGKRVLREILYQYVDRGLIERPKQGFAIPLAQWLRGELREWAEDLLSESALRDTGFLEAAPIRRVWEAHVRGTENGQHKIWVILMLQAWLRWTTECRGSLASPSEGRGCR